MAWLAQSSMFLLLGLLVTPREVSEVGPQALAISIFLMLVARPAAVWAILVPFRFARREIGFIAWMGLRGAVPIVLGMFPLLAGIEPAFAWWSREPYVNNGATPVKENFVYASNTNTQWLDAKSLGRLLEESDE